MRISSRPGDPGYNRLACGGITVYLDGAEVHRCFTADEERGLVVVADLDGQYRTRANHKGTDVRTRELHGVVRIVLAPDSQLARSIGDR